MNILAIECSQPKASLCLSLNGEIKFTTSWETARNHDSFLFPALENALSLLASDKLNLVLVGAGPGSYGGVRVALAAAVGIATVRKSRVVAVGSWDSLATDGAAIISDARRGGWTIRYSDGDISVLSTEELQSKIENGLLVYSIEKEELLIGKGISATKCGLVPTATGLVSTWLQLTAEQQTALADKPAEPIYVRPPHITEAKRKPWEISH